MGMLRRPSSAQRSASGAARSAVRCMLLLATRCVLPKFIVVEPASLVVSKGDVHEELHGYDRTRNDSTLIDLVAGLMEAGPKEVVDATHDGVLENLEPSNVDGCRDQTWTHD